MSPAPEADEVRRAAERRAEALARGDADALRSLLHPDFRWTSHVGEVFDREAYVAANTGGSLRWAAQHLADVEVVVHHDTAVLHCTVTDTVDRGTGPADVTMPMTQVWVRGRPGTWLLLAGHAGPRLVKGTGSAH